MLRARITRLQQDSHGGIRVRRIRAIRVPVLILGIRSMSPRYARQGARPYAKLETPPENAGMAKLADAADLKSAGAKSPVGVRFPLPAPRYPHKHSTFRQRALSPLPAVGAQFSVHHARNHA